MLTTLLFFLCALSWFLSSICGSMVTITFFSIRFLYIFNIIVHYSSAPNSGLPFLNIGSIIPTLWLLGTLHWFHAILEIVVNILTPLFFKIFAMIQSSHLYELTMTHFSISCSSVFLFVMSLIYYNTAFDDHDLQTFLSNSTQGCFF